MADRNQPRPRDAAAPLEDHRATHGDQDQLSDSSFSEQVPDFLSSIEPADLLEGATGKGVRVAVLDTGLDTEHEEMGGVRRQLRGQYTLQGQRWLASPEMGDPANHGTPVTWIVHQVAPEAELHFIQVLPGSLRGSPQVLASGLEFALEQGFQVVNLSLGLESATPRWRARFLDLVDRAFYSDVVLVAAASNRSSWVLPACLSSLISVDMGYFRNPLEFEPRPRAQLLYGPRPHIWLKASGTYVRAPSAGTTDQIYHYTGTSFAAPHLTGIVARLLSRYPGLKAFEVKALLYRMGLFHQRNRTI